MTRGQKLLPWITGATSLLLFFTILYLIYHVVTTHTGPTHGH